MTLILALAFVAATVVSEYNRDSGFVGVHATCSPPYGWRVDKPNPANPHGALVPEPTEQRALARMKALAAQGTPTREIARVLAAEGHPTKRGGTWSSPTVARILGRANTKGTAA